MSDPFLKLLSPEQLPPNGLPISGNDSEQLEDVISKIRRSLNEEIPTRARSLLQATLQTLPNPETELASTKNDEPIPQQCIVNFDHYFNVEHVTSSEPAWSLLKNIAECADIFYGLLENCREISPEDIELQRAGFLTYLDLLERRYLTTTSL